MKKIASSFLLGASLLSSVPTFAVVPEFFGFDWEVQEVTGDQLTLTDNQDVECQVKAYGWVKLGERREVTSSTPWYSRGDTYVKWAWRAIIYNVSEEDRTVNFSTTLKSEKGFTLDEARHMYEHTVSEPVSAEDYSIIQGVREYSASAKYGEGEPDAISWLMTCPIS